MTLERYILQIKTKELGFTTLMKIQQKNNRHIILKEGRKFEEVDGDAE